MINFRVRGLKELQTFLKGVPKRLIGVATEEIADYLVGDESHGLKHYPGYKYITRAQGFPRLSYTTSSGIKVVGYKSARQHRYVMAMISKGVITPGKENRTDTLRDGWQRKGALSKATIQNAVPYAKWVMGDTRQTTMHRKIGWRVIRKVIADNIKGAIKSAEREIAKRVLKRKP